MSAEVKKEIALEIAHVLFIDIVGYSKLPINQQRALEISRALKNHPELQLQMGIHSGPVSGVIDVTGKANVAGAGINMAQRVMDCGDAGHILVSKRVAEISSNIRTGSRTCMNLASVK